MNLSKRALRVISDALETHTDQMRQYGPRIGATVSANIQARKQHREDIEYAENLRDKITRELAL